MDYHKPRLLKAVVANVEEACKTRRWKVPTGARTPMSSDFTPEMDRSTELDPDDITWHQEIVGMLRWATEIGRVDILLELSLLSQYQAAPREGHLVQLLRIIGYLKLKPKVSLHFDPNLPKIDYSLFKTDPTDFHEMYRDAKEELPCDHVEPHGRPITMTAFVDASFASNKKTHNHTQDTLYSLIDPRHAGTVRDKPL